MAAVTPSQAGLRYGWHARLCVAALFTVALLATSTPFSWGLEPPRPGEVDGMERAGHYRDAVARAEGEGNNRVDPGLVRQLQQRLTGKTALPGITPGPAGFGTDWRTWMRDTLSLAPAEWAPLHVMRSIPSTGLVRVPVVLIDFTDEPASTSPQDLDSLINGPGEPTLYPQESLASYYDRSSYGQLHIQGDVLGIYHAPYARSSVPTEDLNREMQTIEEAFRYFDERGTDFSVYDADNDGDIDYSIAFWTGQRGEWASFWWGRYRSSHRSSNTYDGKLIGAYSWQWEPTDRSAGTVIHETGHALGLPDLYDYDQALGPQGGVGAWDQMGAGDCDHNAYSKMLLGWLSPSVVAGENASLTLRPTSSTADAAIVMPSYSLSDPFREFFIAQTRVRSGNDSTAPFPDEPSLMVWHIDPLIDCDGNFRWDNSRTSHKLLRLMEADGQEHVENGQPSDSEDLFAPGQSFGPSTVPSSTTYVGQRSGVSIPSIWSVDGSLGVDLGLDAPAAVDRTPPVTTFVGPTNWVRSSAIAFIVIDQTPVDTWMLDSSWWYGPLSYRPDEPTAPYVLYTEGEHLLQYRSMDWAGNLEETRTAHVWIDATPPVTTSTVSGDSQVWVSISATDLLSGVAERRFSLDGNPSVQYSTPIKVTGAGTHTISVWSSDKAGNVETPSSRTFLVRTGTRLTSGWTLRPTYRARAVVSATLTDAGGRALAGKALVLKSASGATITTFKATSAAGVYTGTAPLVRSKTAFRITFGGDGTFAPSSHGVNVLPKVSLSTPVAASAVARRRTFTVTTVLMPRHPQGTLPVQFRCYRLERSGDASVWRLRNTVSAKAYDYWSNTRCRASVSLPYSGTWRICAYHPEDTLNSVTVSAYRGIRVR